MEQARQAIQARIVAAAHAAGRNPADITLIAVSKTHPAETVRAAYAAGLRAFGENRVQEAEEKIASCADLGPTVEWHLIGHLQRNKAKKAASLFDVVHSLDRVELAQALSRYRLEAGRAPLRVLLQCNVSGEASKEGYAAAGWETDPALAAQIIADAREVSALPGLQLIGLMTVAPYADDPEAVRPVFASLRRLRDMLQRALGIPLPALSMGMSGDLAVAIAEGATMVRIGRALFGERG